MLGKIKTARSLYFFGWLSPWTFPVFSNFYNYKYSINLDRVFLSLVVLLISICPSFYTMSFVPLLNALVFCIALFYKSIDIDISDIRRSTDIYIYCGLAFGLIINLFTETRVGLYGGEPNFSSYIIGLYIIVNLVEKRWTNIFAVMLISLYITGSRMLLVGIFYTLFSYKNSKRPIVLIGFAFAVFLLMLFANSFLELLDDSGLMVGTGYIESIDRLYNLNDPSTLERLYVANGYYDYFITHPLSVLFGINGNEFESLVNHQIGRLPHNSYLERIAIYGLPMLMAVVILFIFMLPFWVVACILFYGFFLHSLFSIPLMLLLRIYIDKVNHENKTKKYIQQ